MTKVLVTGAGGYIGSIATYLLLQKGYEVVAVDNFSTGYHGPLNLLKEKFVDALSVHELDLQRDISSVFEQNKDIKAVLHFAASCLVDESMKNPAKYFENNVLSPLNILKQMELFNVRNIIFSSTCAVYGETQYVPVDEKHVTSPINPYGESKLMAENIIRWYGKVKGFNYMILRYFNVCGASDDGLIGDSKKPSSLLVQNAVRGALGIELFTLTCPEVNTPDKTPIRDYINVVDLNEAHILALEHLLASRESSALNLGTGKGNSVLEIVKKVEDATGKKLEFKRADTPRAGEYAKIYAAIGKAKEVLGWEPKHSIEDSVKSLIVWYTSHPDGWDK